MKTVTFYHSAICPRCQMVSRSIRALLSDYPEIQIERVEYLSNLQRAREAGVRAIPALVHEAGELKGFYLTKPRLRAYFDSVSASDPPG